jgi:methionine-gamma-lyase
MNKEYGYGGMLVLELKSVQEANDFMRMLQMEGVGYLAVSLGYFKTLFSNSGKSTSSEVPEDLQRNMGLSEGLVRFSIGLDNHIERSFEKIRECLVKLHVI